VAVGELDDQAHLLDARQRMGLVVGREDYTNSVMVWSLDPGKGVVSRSELRVLDNTDEVIRIVNNAVDEGGLTTESHFARMEPRHRAGDPHSSESETDDGYDTDEDYVPTAAASAGSITGGAPRRSSRLREKTEQVHYLSEKEASAIKGLKVCFTLEKLLPVSGRIWSVLGWVK
jgi:hypothetical protein